MYGNASAAQKSIRKVQEAKSQIGDGVRNPSAFVFQMAISSLRSQVTAHGKVEVTVGGASTTPTQNAFRTHYVFKMGKESLKAIPLQHLGLDSCVRHQRFLYDKGSTSHTSHFSLQTGIAIFVQPDH